MPHGLWCAPPPNPRCPLARKAGPGAPPSAQQGSQALGCQRVNQSLNESLQMPSVRRLLSKAKPEEPLIPVFLQVSGEWQRSPAARGFKLIAEHNSYQREARVLAVLRGWNLPEMLLLFLLSLCNPREGLKP